jgi:Transposase DDE domain
LVFLSAWSLAEGSWADRYGARIDSYRFPKGQDARTRWTGQAGRDGFTLLDAIGAPQAPAWLRQIPAVEALRRAWAEQFLLPREQHELLARQRAEQQTAQWKARYDIRAGVEGTISQAIRRTQLRRTPYRGQPKTHLANILSATAINLIRADAWLNGTPLGTTRVSHLARLGLAA